MRRFYLEGKHYKTRDPEMGRFYRRQTNFCSRLYKKERKKYYTRLDIREVTDNKKFWKTMKPFLTDKAVNSDKITLIENDKTLDEDGEVDEILNNFFSDVPKNLGVVENSYLLSDTSN